MNELQEYKKWIYTTLDRTSTSNDPKVILHREWLKKELSDTKKLIREQEEDNNYEPISRQ